jgi:hypothetical protein
MDIVLKLNDAWSKSSGKADNLIVKHKAYCYNLSKKRRYKLSKKRRYRKLPRPIRWGESDVLEASPTAAYIDHLYRTEKDPGNLHREVDKYCGFICKTQVPPVVVCPSQVKMRDQQPSELSNYSQPENQVDRQVEHHRIYLDRSFTSSRVDQSSVASSSNLSRLPPLPPVSLESRREPELYRTYSHSAVPYSPEKNQPSRSYNRVETPPSVPISATTYRRQHSGYRCHQQWADVPYGMNHPFHGQPIRPQMPYHQQFPQNPPVNLYRNVQAPYQYHLNPHNPSQRRLQQNQIALERSPEQIPTSPLESINTSGSTFNSTISPRSHEDPSQELHNSEFEHKFSPEEL